MMFRNEVAKCPHFQAGKPESGWVPFERRFTLHPPPALAVADQRGRRVIQFRPGHRAWPKGWPFGAPRAGCSLLPYTTIARYTALRYGRRWCMVRRGSSLLQPSAAAHDSAEDRAPNPIDVHVGDRIRSRRVLLGLSQGNLGAVLGLTFQQVQKYERGLNRVAASRLFELSCVLQVPISFFFDGFPGPERRPADRSDGLLEPVAAHNLDHRETLELVRAYYRIKDHRKRSKVFRADRGDGAR